MAKTCRRAGTEQLLKQTIEAGLKLKAVKPHQLKRVNVNTTVKEKDIRFPTDARLHDRARQRSVDEAKKRGMKLPQISTIEPGIGHLKREHRMDRNRLKGRAGDRINAILSAAGMNFAKLLKWAAAFLRLIFNWLFGYQRALLVLPTN